MHYIILCFSIMYIYITIIFILVEQYISLVRKLLQYIEIVLYIGFIWAVTIFIFYY